MNNTVATQPLLEVIGLDSAYGALPVLRKAALRVNRGEVVALFGPNGHGKSTLLKVICGLHPALAGTVRFKGIEIQKAPSQKIVEMGIAYIPEARNLFNEMTVLENLTMGAYNRLARKDLGRNLELVFALSPA